MRQNYFGRALGAAVCAFLLSSCGGSSDSSPPVANTETIAVALSGANEVPPVTTAGSGTGSLTVDRDSGALSGSITVSGLSGAANAAHIHSAYAGIIGGVIVTLAADATVPGKFNVPAGTTLSSSDLATFMAGGTYVNAHTAANGGGEVRGQVAPAGIEVARCVATGDFEVPPVTTTGSGVAYATVNTTSGAIVANIRTSGIADANAAHVHQGVAGTNGGPALALAQDGAAPALWAASGTLSSSQLSAFRAGETYVNVHTPDSPNGLIRCQLTPKPITVVRFTLDGAQQVPPVTTTTATGIGYITVNETSGAVVANARTSNLPTAIAAHVHQAAAGANGSPIVTLAVSGAEFWTGTGTFSAALLTAFKADQTYINVHSPAFPDGEIRGQIVLP